MVAEENGCPRFALVDAFKRRAKLMMRGVLKILQAHRLHETSTRLRAPLPYCTAPTQSGAPSHLHIPRSISHLAFIFSLCVFISRFCFLVGVCIDLSLEVCFPEGVRRPLKQCP